MKKSELTVADWMKSTQDDLDTVSLVSQVPLLVPTYYHCEQAIEKILKAYIIAKENILTKTHDLNELRRICETHSPDFSGFEDICDEISAYSAIRYPPNINLTIRQMRKTIKDTFEIVDFTKSKLKDLGYEVPESSTTAAMEEVKEAIRVLRQQKSGAVGCG